jgi:hypothetical protein
MLAKQFTAKRGSNRQRDLRREHNFLAGQRAEYAIGGAILCTRLDRQPSRCYFFLPDPNVGCQPAAVPFWLGAAAIVLTLSFLGFLVSRLLFAMPSSLD